MAASARRLGWTPFPAPVATVGPVGRRALGGALRDGRLSVLTRRIACELTTANDGSASGARIWHEGRERLITARRVVLCCGTYENVRLLLLSRSAQHPAGVGNDSGQVGARFATHSFAAVHGLFPGRDLGRSAAPSGHATAVAEFDASDNEGTPSIDGASLLQAAMGPPPSRLPGVRASPAESVGTAWAQAEQPPNPAHRLDLDPAVRDPLGRSRLRATHRLRAADVRRAVFLQDRMEDWLREAGAVRIWRPRPRATTLSTHAYGGTCMGAEPAGSVVDRHGMVHDTRGLVVLGASTFPTAGGRGPTQTIEALTWRAAERSAAELA
jgi:gluconate 2-dehydrogenase alpha chain